MANAKQSAYDKPPRAQVSRTIVKPASVLTLLALALVPANALELLVIPP